MVAKDDVIAGVGPRLRALRQERGGTLAALSETTGISVSTLSRLARKKMRFSSPDFGVNPALGPSPSKTPGAPRRKEMPCWEGDRSTSTSSRDDSALTTEAPTPCRPPVAT